MDKSAERPRIQSLAEQRPATARSPLRLVTNELLFGGVADQVPAEWRDALSVLMTGERTEIAWAGEVRRSGLQHLRHWAITQGAGSDALLFAPWQGWSPADLQSPAGAAMSPRAQWMASYLFDCGADRPLHRPVIDLMLASPHPAACAVDEDCGLPLPRLKTLNAMLEAARSQDRERIVIITQQRAASAMARRLLATGRTGSRTGCQLEVVAIEDALGHLMSGASGWDAVIVLPELRSIVLAILAEATNLAGPFPLLWHDRSLAMISAETLRPVRPHQPLDASLLVHSLALAARNTGMAELAHRLFAGWARLRDSGVATPSRGSHAPYATTLSEAEFVARIPSVDRLQGRRLPLWQALPACDGQKQGNNPPCAPVNLILVASH